MAVVLFDARWHEQQLVKSAGVDCYTVYRVPPGVIVGHRLFWAVGEFHALQDLSSENIPKNPAWRRQGLLAADPDRTDREVEAWISERKALKLQMLGLRERDVRELIGAGIMVRLTEREGSRTLGEGKLTGYDLGKAAVALTAGDEVLEVPFAARNPVPEGVQQTYYGTHLTADFDLLDFPQDKAWLFQNGPNY